VRVRCQRPTCSLSSALSFDAITERYHPRPALSRVCAAFIFSPLHLAAGWPARMRYPLSWRATGYATRDNAPVQ